MASITSRFSANVRFAAKKSLAIWLRQHKPFTATFEAIPFSSLPQSHVDLAQKSRFHRCSNEFQTTHLAARGKTVG
jgi:hypothetical protein